MGEKKNLLSAQKMLHSAHAPWSLMILIFLLVSGDRTQVLLHTASTSPIPPVFWVPHLQGRQKRLQI